MFSCHLSIWPEIHVKCWKMSYVCPAVIVSPVGGDLIYPLVVLEIWSKLFSVELLSNPF